MFTRVAMTAKNTVTMSDGPRGSAGTFPSRLEARVCQNVADPAQLALRSVAALVRPSVVLIENRFLRPVVTGGETEDTCDGSTHGH